MPDVTVKFRDGPARRVPAEHYGRGPVSVSYEPGFVVVTDEYGAKVSFPTERVEEVVVSAPIGRW
jgi:hypothetical protein